MIPPRPCDACHLYDARAGGSGSLPERPAIRGDCSDTGTTIPVSRSSTRRRAGPGTARAHRAAATSAGGASGRARRTTRGLPMQTTTRVHRQGASVGADGVRVEQRQDADEDLRRPQSDREQTDRVRIRLISDLPPAVSEAAVPPGTTYRGTQLAGSARDARGAPPLPELVLVEPVREVAERQAGRRDRPRRSVRPRRCGRTPAPRRCGPCPAPPTARRRPRSRGRATGSPGHPCSRGGGCARSRSRRPSTSGFQIPTGSASSAW